MRFGPNGIVDVRASYEADASRMDALDLRKKYGDTWFLRPKTLACPPHARFQKDGSYARINYQWLWQEEDGTHVFGFDMFHIPIDEREPPPDGSSVILFGRTFVVAAAKLIGIQRPATGLVTLKQTT